MQKLLSHQVKYARGYKDKELMCWETGAGKTIAAAVWLRDNRDRDALVICPKRVVKKWQKALKDWGTRAMVLSKEQFMKSPEYAWSAIVVDEADEFASPLFVAGRSQRTLALYDLVKAYPRTPILLLTATPIRSSPWNLHTLLCFKGNYIDWKGWRNQFFELLFPGAWGPTSRPFLSRPTWMPKDDWRTEIRKVLEKNADIVLLKDCVSDVPAIEEEIVETDTKPFTPTSWEATAAFHEQYRHEQEGKHKAVLDIGRQYRKVLVVAYYVEQVEELGKQLSRDRQTFVVHGGVKNQEDILLQANAADECYLVVQAELGVGFDANTFSCVVFASMAYGVQKFVQMKGRVRRINDLHPVKYYYLIGGKAGQAVYDSIQSGKEFVPSEYRA